MSGLHLTFVQSSIGHAPDRPYLKTWCMEPLGLAVLAALTPPGTRITLVDDRLEAIPYAAPTDAVILSVETYTALRAYEIASGFRRAGVPVIMGGFHPTAVPEEAERYAEAVVVGEVEDIWLELLDDIRHNTLKRRYTPGRPVRFGDTPPRRDIYAHNRYLPITLMETGRGCANTCEFCSVQNFYQRTYRKRSLDGILRELRETAGQGKLLFFVDDNFSQDREATRTLLNALRKERVSWVTQADVATAHDADLLQSMRRAGCGGMLIGFESLRDSTLRAMNKGVNLTGGGYAPALRQLDATAMAVFATFVFGWDEDKGDAFEETLEFAVRNHFFLAAFNQLMPFPGTGLYRRLREEKRLRRDPWWLDKGYRFNTVPFTPRHMTAEELSLRCLALRKRFYSAGNILRRALHLRHWRNGLSAKGYFPLNILHRLEAGRRHAYPLGDAAFQGPLLVVQ